MLTWDVQYGFEFDLSQATTALTVGLLNATDEAPPRVWDAANFSYDPRQHDARGRMAYVNVKVGF